MTLILLYTRNTVDYWGVLMSIFQIAGVKYVLYNAQIMFLI